MVYTGSEEIFGYIYSKASKAYNEPM